MARLVLINGAPGSGKSTIADRLAVGPGAVAFDLDVLKHSIEGWEDDPTAAGLEARRQFLRLAEGTLSAGRDVYLGQFLAKVDFIEELESIARATDSEFVELVLVVSSDTLARRLTDRAASPTRTEHHVNNRLVGPDDAGDLAAAIDALLQLRPHGRAVEASGTLEETLVALEPFVTG